MADKDARPNPGPIKLTLRDAVTNEFIAEFDATLSESHQFQADLTEFPVESGTEVSDHRRQKPFQLTVSALISNTPIERYDLKGSPDGPHKPWTPGSAEEVAKSFALWHRSNQRFNVVTRLGTYTNMFLTAFSFPRDPKTGEILRVDMTLRQVTLVKTERVKSSVPARGKVKIGKIETKPTPPETEAKVDRSIAKQALEAGKKALQRLGQ